MVPSGDDAADSGPCNKSFTGKEDTPLTELIMKDLASDSCPETPATGILQVSLTGCFGKKGGGEKRDRRCNGEVAKILTLKPSFNTTQLVHL